MLSVKIYASLESGWGNKHIANIGIKRSDDDYNYHWTIESNGEVVEGQLDNFERSRGPLELVWQVLSLYMLNKENREIVNEWMRGLISISVEESK